MGRERELELRVWRDYYFGCFQTITQCIGEGKTEDRLDRELTRVDCRLFINGGLFNTSSGPVATLVYRSLLSRGR
jgi:hypothetical protein